MNNSQNNIRFMSLLSILLLFVGCLAIMSTAGCDWWALFTGQNVVDEGQQDGSTDGDQQNSDDGSSDDSGQDGDAGSGQEAPDVIIDPLSVKGAVDNSTLKPGQSTQLSASVTGGVEPYNLQWETKPAGQAGITIDAPQSADTAVSFEASVDAGDYSFEVTVTDSENKSASAEVIIIIQPLNQGGGNGGGNEVPNRVTAYDGGLRLDLGNGVTMDLIEIPAGTFTMGSITGDDDEDPQHSVEISNKFYIGKYEVTQAQWQAIMDDNPSEYPGNDNRPVESVSWDDSQNFCNVLSSWIGRIARLPTEAEWEYACRANSTTKYYFGDDTTQLGDYAWYASNTGWETEEVGGKLPNDFGLYDMLGGVWEWCQDWHDDDYYAVSPATDPPGPDTGTYKVMRGGGWRSFSSVCRSANRGWFGSSSSADDIGLRVVVEAE